MNIGGDIEMLANPAARVARPASVRWLILRTAGPKTLPLAKSLSAAGFDAWTPETTMRRRGRKDREVQVPILPTFVFVGERHLRNVAALAVDPTSRHPAFSLFMRDNSVPLIGDRTLEGLREKEAAENASYQALLDGETREEARLARIAMLKSESARRKALRAERRDFRPGTFVTVTEAPALTGLTGEIVKSDGTQAVVAFGGSLIMTIEAWRLIPNAVDATATDAA